MHPQRGFAKYEHRSEVLRCAVSGGGGMEVPPEREV